MGFIDAIKTCFGKYVTFSGRASRAEYWWFLLFILIGGLLAGLLDMVIFATPDSPEGEVSDTNGPINSIFTLLTFLPLLAAAWRRMHDAGKPGKLLLLPLVVTIGMMFLLTLGLIGAGGIERAAGDPATGPVLAIGTIGIFVMLALQLGLSILILWWLTRASQPGTNEYGPNPHEVTP
ncbi:DUF805 domain-containing protein [Sulfitobacter sp. LCG007]